MSNRLRSVVEMVVGVSLAAVCIYLWAPRGQAAEPLSLIPLDSAAAARLGEDRPLRGAGVTVVAFNDFQCPWCARFDSALRELEGEYKAIHVVFRHRPLTGIHPAAFAAAVSSECARNQGRFPEYSRLLFTNQHLIGVKAWSSFARDAGVGDSSRFAACITGDSLARATVERDLAASASLRSRGTPSFIIDGEEPSRAPTIAELRDLLVARATRK